jgi:Cdc6-like AAA superfamily ATPase
MDHGVRVSEVYEVYKQWIERMGEKPWAQITFTRKLKELEYQYKFAAGTTGAGKARQLFGVDILPGGGEGVVWEAGGVK